MLDPLSWRGGCSSDDVVGEEDELISLVALERILIFVLAVGASSSASMVLNLSLLALMGIDCFCFAELLNLLVVAFCVFKSISATSRKVFCGSVAGDKDVDVVAISTTFLGRPALRLACFAFPMIDNSIPL